MVFHFVLDNTQTRKRCNSDSFFSKNCNNEYSLQKYHCMLFYKKNIIKTLCIYIKREFIGLYNQPNENLDTNWSFWINEQHDKAALGITTYAQRNILTCNSTEIGYIKTSYIYKDRIYWVVQSGFMEIWIQIGVSKIKNSRDIFQTIQ